MFGKQKISMEIDFEDYTEDVKKMTVQQIKHALNMCGAQAASFAAMNCSAHLKPVIDTGLLRNSLTWALASKPPKIQDYKGDRPSRYKKDGVIPRGRYDGVAPDDQKGEHCVYIGTNVFYAVYNEMGTVRMAARPYLKPALMDHIDDYKTIFIEYLEKLSGEGKLGK